jgi:hypothetical protein
MFAPKTTIVRMRMRMTGSVRRVGGVSVRET